MNKVDEQISLGVIGTLAIDDFDTAMKSINPVIMFQKYTKRSEYEKFDNKKYDKDTQNLLKNSTKYFIIFQLISIYNF